MISCIMPVYNGERFIQESLDSIFTQTTRPDEVIVVDDGSTDGTAHLVKQYPQTIRYHYQPNQRVTSALNTGIRLAHGDFITFLDADDLWAPNKTECQLACLQQDPAIGYCVGHAQNFWMKEMQHEQEKFKHHPRARPIPGYVASTLMVRRTVLDKIGLFNASLHHGYDTDWFLRCKEAGVRGVLLPDVLLRRRLHSNNISRAMATNSHQEYLRLLKKHLDQQRASASPIDKEGRNEPT